MRKEAARQEEGRCPWLKKKEWRNGRRLCRRQVEVVGQVQRRCFPVQVATCRGRTYGALEYVETREVQPLRQGSSRW